MKIKKHPNTFATEVSINLADDMDLMGMMAQSGFMKVFDGIEFPDETCLLECNKFQDNNRNMTRSVNIIQNYGMEITAGFIVGFDNDPPDIFQQQIDFMQAGRIVTEMLGLLNAPRFSKLYYRLNNEGRIVNMFTGNNTYY